MPLSYPPHRFPVLAFASAPAAFPSVESDWPMQRHIRWSERTRAQAAALVDSTLGRPFVGIHLRAGVDWTPVCDLIREGKAAATLFASAQCTSVKGALTHEMCLPTMDTLLDEVERAVRRVKARSVFISSDTEAEAPLADINQRLAGLAVADGFAEAPTAHRLPPDTDAPVPASLALLGMADHFVGNCVSTFSAFVARQRSGEGAATSFFGFTPTAERRAPDEL